MDKETTAQQLPYAFGPRNRHCELDNETSNMSRASALLQGKRRASINPNYYLYIWAFLEEILNVFHSPAHAPKAPHIAPRHFKAHMGVETLIQPYLLTKMHRSTTKLLTNTGALHLVNGGHWPRSAILVGQRLTSYNLSLEPETV